MIAGFLICMALALTIGAILTVCAVVVVGAREDRSLPGALGSSPWPQVDAWEEHVRTTPGLLDISDEGMREFEADMAGGAW